MTVTAPMRTVKEPVWTPRQREVLDLLVRGKTNTEIAGALGISLDGAKWHVSEIITRLGVDSRDEAAEYWRHHNGLRMRFTRIASGFFSSGVLKWGAATAFIGGVVVASAMVIVAMRESGGESSEPSAGDPPAAETPDTNSPGGQPGTNPGSPATPLPTGEVIAGVPVTSVSFTKPGSLPVPMSVIVERGCYQCDGPASGFDRISLNPAGQIRVDELYRPTSGYIAQSYFDPAGRVHYLSICSRGYCGGVGQVSNDAQTTLLRSTDGGVTWQQLETYDGMVSVTAITAQGVLLNRSTFANGVTDYRFQLLGQTATIRPPAGFEPAYSMDRVVGWQRTGGREVVNFDGSALVTLPDVGLPADRLGQMRIEGQLSTGDVLISWLNGPKPTEQYRYLGLMQGGQLQKILRADASLTVGNFLNQGIAFGNVWASPTDVDPASSNNGGKLHPMLLDLHTGQIELLEFYGPAFSDAYDGQRNRIREVEPGPFVRVTGAGDCLNVRETPATSAKSLGCFADKVLLKNLGAEQQAGGITWWKVATPAGAEGWASRDEGAQPRQ